MTRWREFLRRLNLSNFIVSSELVSTKLRSTDVKLPGGKKGKVEPVVHFEVECEIQYR